MATAPTIRLAAVDDIPMLAEFRTRMFRDMGWTDEARLEELRPRYSEYILQAAASGDFVAWIAEQDDQPVGGCGLLWERVPPTCRNLSGRQAYILAVYVVPEARRQGVAQSMLEQAVAYARENGAEVISLHYSPAGKGLYEKYGFSVSPEMRLFTDPQSAAWSPNAPLHTAADDAD